MQAPTEQPRSLTKPRTRRTTVRADATRHACLLLGLLPPVKMLPNVRVTPRNAFPMFAHDLRTSAWTSGGIVRSNASPKASRGCRHMAAVYKVCESAEEGCCREVAKH